MNMYLVNINLNTVAKMTEAETHKYMAKHSAHHCGVFVSAIEAVRYIDSWIRCVLDGNKDDEYKSDVTKNLASLIVETYEI